MKLSTISSSQIAKHYQVLSKIGALGEAPESGFLRAAYSKEETQAMRYIESVATAAGLSSRWDAIGNLILETSSPSQKYIEIGSHLDTVPLGGNFDGAAGIVAGLEAILEVAPRLLSNTVGLRLRIWRAEESATFGSVYTGSLAAFGKLPAKVLANKFGELSLENAIKSQGYDPEIIRNQIPTITQAEIDSIVAHFELHIEQASILEVTNTEIGIVTSIRGPARYRVQLRGAFDHSGGTPLGVKFRRDVNLALAHILVELDKLAQDFMASGQDLVQTCGVINSDPQWNSQHDEVYQNALTKVSGYGYFLYDVRSSSNSSLASYLPQALKVIEQTSEKFRVQSIVAPITSSPAVESLTPAIQELEERACKNIGCSYRRLASGGGHDSGVVAQQKKTDGSFIPVGMVFIPCREGISHSPNEYTSYESIATGAQVLSACLQELAGIA